MERKCGNFLKFTLDKRLLHNRCKMVVKKSDFNAEQMKYLKEIETQLKAIYSDAEIAGIMKAVYSDARSYVFDNPGTSLEQFKEHIQINDVLCDWIENTPADHIISKINTKSVNKKIFFIIAFCILIFICLSILSLEIRNWIIDTAFENLKVISN